MIENKALKAKLLALARAAETSRFVSTLSPPQGGNERQETVWAFLSAIESPDEQLEEFERELNE